jgi:hypothetical protein
VTVKQAKALLARTDLQMLVQQEALQEACAAAEKVIPVANQHELMTLSDVSSSNTHPHTP